MSEVSGLSLKTFPLFVKDKFKEEGLEKWNNALSEALKDVYARPIIGFDDWFDFNAFFIAPMQLVCDLFYDGDEKSAWEMGRFSADYALKGVLKVFVRMGTTLFLMKRAATIISKYYKPMDMAVIKSDKNFAILSIVNFPDYHKLLEYRICGWIERALEISGCTNINIDVIKTMDDGDDTVEIKFQWD